MIVVAATSEVAALSLAPDVVRRGRDWLIFGGVLLVAATLATIDVPGYFGGRWDDGRYLDAALQWVARGPSLGTDHWALRWPVVLPTAAAIELFGRNRAAAMLPGLTYFFALLTLNFWAIRRFFGARVAGIALLVLMTTAEVMLSATRLTAELPELLFWTASVWAFVMAATTPTRDRGWMVAAGLAAGLAWATRETAMSLIIAFAAMFAAGIGPRRANYKWLAAGFFAVALPEQASLWHASGDWLYRLHTDLRHIELPSTNLRGLVAPGQFAPMNVTVASRWAGAGPVHLFWALDPWLNLLLNARYSLTFLLAAVAAGGVRAIGARPRGGWRLIGLLAAVGALHIAVVVYVIATDPKPRMFMPALACAALIVALCAAPSWHRRPTRMLLGGLGMLKLSAVIVSISVGSVYNRGYPALAEQVVADAPGVVYANRWTRSRLALGAPPLLARLADGLPPVGGLWLTSGNIKDDTRFDTVPPPPARWTMVGRYEGRATPFTLPLIELFARVSGTHPLAGLSPVVVLYRRLPDAPKPLPAR